MPSPYGLDIVESCLTCKLREQYIFCNLPPAAVEHLEKIRTVAEYPKGSVLFVEGQSARGVFILCHGRAKLSTSSAEGKTVILRIAEPGEVVGLGWAAAQGVAVEVVGLGSAVSGKPYDATAETLEPTQANFISRRDLLEFLAKNGDVALRVAQQLSHNYHAACTEVRYLALADSATEKLARLLLEWSTGREQKPGGEVRLKVTLTHEEISQLLGTSRETVTRALSELKKRQLVEVKGSTLIIHSRPALERLVNA